MQQDPNTFEIGTCGGRLARSVLVAVRQANHRESQTSLLNRVEDFAAWLREHYVTRSKESPASYESTVRSERVQRQLGMLTPRERTIYDEVGSKPRNANQILDSLMRKFPGEFNDKNEIYRDLGVLKKCLLIDKANEGYIRLV